MQHAPSADRSCGQGRVGEAVAAARRGSVSDAGQPTERGGRGRTGQGGPPSSLGGMSIASPPSHSLRIGPSDPARTSPPFASSAWRAWCLLADAVSIPPDPAVARGQWALVLSVGRPLGQRTVWRWPCRRQCGRSQTVVQPGPRSVRLHVQHLRRAGRVSTKSTRLPFHNRVLAYQCGVCRSTSVPWQMDTSAPAPEPHPSPGQVAEHIAVDGLHQVGLDEPRSSSATPPASSRQPVVGLSSSSRSLADTMPITSPATSTGR